MLFSVYICFLLFAAMGGALLWQPQLITRVTGQELTTLEARNEVRAVYGGFGVGEAVSEGIIARRGLQCRRSHEDTHLHGQIFQPL